MDIDLKMKELYVHDSLLNMLSKWEMSLIEPNWIENKNWNVVTEMIYQDLMANRDSHESNLKEKCATFAKNL